MSEHCCYKMDRELGRECQQHPDPFDCPDRVIGKFSDGTYGLMIHDGGSAMYEISCCPWCGASLVPDDVGAKP